MEHLDVTQSEFDGIITVFESCGIELLHFIQDGQVEIYSHFDEVELVLWARGIIDGEKAIDTVISKVEVVSIAL